MGISSLPSPSEGMLCVVLVNTALSISIFKGILKSVLHLVGIHLSSSPSSSSSLPSESFDLKIIQDNSFLEEFKNQTPALKFSSLCSYNEHHKCSVCLTKFEAESEINNLNCGHLFHRKCLETWIHYLNITCPLCRTALVAQQQQQQISV